MSNIDGVNIKRKESSLTMCKILKWFKNASEAERAEFLYELDEREVAESGKHIWQLADEYEKELKNAKQY